MKTAFGKLTLEALIVGILFVILFALVHYGFMFKFGDDAMTNHWLLAIQVIISGALGHYVFEYTGLNSWYCNQR